MMNRFIKYAFSVCLAVILTSELSGQEFFQRIYGGGSYDYGRGVLQAADGGFIVAGTTGSFGLESAEVMLIKTTPEGFVEWRNTYGGPFADQALSLDQAQNGDLIIGGFTERIGKSYDAYALRIKPDGDTVWTKHYGGDLWDFGRQIVPTADGGFAMLGQTFSYGAGNGDFYLLRLDANGDTLWTRTYGGSAEESGESIAIMPDGGFVLAGYTESYGSGSKDGYVIRTDANGDTLWTRAFGAFRDDRFNGVTTTMDGGIVAVGSTTMTDETTNFMIQKFGADGSLSWSFIDGGPLNDGWNDVIEDTAGNLIMAGYTASFGSGANDFWLLRLGGSGDINPTFGTTGSETAYDVKVTLDGGYVIVGDMDGTLTQFDDAYLVKTNFAGVGGELPNDVGEIVSNERSYKVTVGPNPFIDSPTLIIDNYSELKASLSEPIEIQVFSMMGALIYSDRIVDKSTRLIEMNLSKGIYSYQLVSGATLLTTGKMVSIR